MIFFWGVIGVLACFGAAYQDAMQKTIALAAMGIGAYIMAAVHLIKSK